MTKKTSESLSLCGFEVIGRLIYSLESHLLQILLQIFMLDSHKARVHCLEYLFYVTMELGSRVPITDLR